MAISRKCVHFSPAATWFHFHEVHQLVQCLVNDQGSSEVKAFMLWNVQVEAVDGDTPIILIAKLIRDVDVHRRDLLELEIAEPLL
jgi:hypothetical protein